MKQQCRVLRTEDPLSQSWALLPQRCLNDTHDRLKVAEQVAAPQEKYESSDILSRASHHGWTTGKRGEYTVLTGI